MAQRAWVTGALVGAAVGAAVGYLYGTDEGARRRVDLARLIDRVVVDADEARQLWARLHEAWNSFDKATMPGPRGRASGGWSPGGAA